jgi:hypothetical protein
MITDRPGNDAYPIVAMRPCELVERRLFFAVAPHPIRAWRRSRVRTNLCNSHPRDGSAISQSQAAIQPAQQGTGVLDQPPTGHVQFPQGPYMRRATVRPPPVRILG